VRAALLVLVLLAGAGAVGWLVLKPAGAPAPDLETIPDRPGGDRTSAPEAVPVARAEPAVVPSRGGDVPEDPEWHTAPLPLPKGRGPLRGEELIAAVEAGGKVRFRGATDADLQALRAAVFDDADRDQPQPHAAMMGWLKEAGFEVELSWPDLVVRRRTDADGTGR
jgi:hypothetical protein